MRIEFINHSSLIITTNDTKILCDPWFKGSAFANGWRLLHDDAININALDFDMLWISHEHPDHFSVATLKSLEVKKPVLYQETKDKKVKGFLEAQGHIVTELSHDIAHRIDGFNVTSIVTEGYDSCILIEDGQTKFLNINDSQLDKEQEIKKVTRHTPIDLISIQFHYANWAGNLGDDEIPEYKRAQAVNRIKKICDICGTRDVILFASFIYYAHEENFYWNQSFSHITRTIDDLKDYGLNPIIMVPGQIIELDGSENYRGASRENDRALNFWKEKYGEREVKEFSTTHELGDIEKLYVKFLEKLRDKNNLGKFDQKILRTFRLYLHITDLELSVGLGVFQKAFEVFPNKGELECDVSLSSEALSMLLQHDFALGSVTISSRIQFNYENAYKFYFFFLIPYRNNIGTFLKNSIKEDLNFQAFQSNGVLKPIFHFNKRARKKFDEFNSRLEAL